MATKLTHSRDLDHVVGEVINRRYEVLEPLGAGGQGIVYKVRDLAQAGRLRALKAPTGLAGREVAERIRWEFVRLARLDHGRLLRVFELDTVESPAAGLAAGQVFFTAEYVVGQPPAQMVAHLDRSARVDLLWRVATDVASALDHIHAHGLLHGDVTPDNLLCTVEGDVKLLDLGLSVSRGAMAPDGGISGTLPFLAPEALAGCQEPRSDLYGLGATLYAIATGRPPRPVPEALPVAEQVRALLETPVVPLGEMTEDLPAGLVDLVESLVADEPEARPSSAAAVLARIARRRRSLSLALGGQGQDLPLLATGLVGREDLLGELFSVFRQRFSPTADRAGHPAILVLRGPEGVGRGALMADLGRRLQVAAARGQTGPFVLAEGRTIEEAARRALPGHMVSLRDEVARVRLLEALETRTAERGVLLLLRNPASDREALRDLCALLARDSRLSLGRLGIVLREAPEADRLPGTVLERTVDPLDADALSRLAERAVGGPVPQSFVAALLEASCGLPAVALGILRAAWTKVRDRRKVPQMDLSRLAVRELDALARSRIARLSGKGTGLATALAASPEPLSVSWAAEVAALSPLDAVAALEELEAHGLLRRIGDRLALAHESLRAPLLEKIGAEPDGLEAVHRRLARLYGEAAEAGDEAALLAQIDHLRHCGRTPELARLARRAASLASQRGEWRRAADLLSVALDASEATTPEPDDTRLELAEALVRSGAYAEARQVLEPLQATAAPLEALRAATLHALSLQREGALDAAIAQIDRALQSRSLPQDDSATRWLYQAQAIWVRILAERGEAEPIWERYPAEGPLPAGNDAAPLLEAVGLAAYYAGRSEHAARWFAAAVERARQGQDRPALARALGCDGMVRQAQGDLVGAQERYAEAWDLAEQVGDLHSAAHFAANLGAVLREQGRLAQALEPSVESVRRMVQLGYEAKLPVAVYNLGNLLLSLGDLPGVARELALLQEAVEQGSGAERMAGYRDLLAAELGRRCRLAGEPPPRELPEALRAPPSDLARRAREAFSRGGASREELYAGIAELESLVAEGRTREAARRTRSLGSAVAALDDPLADASLAMALGRLCLAGGLEPAACLPRLESASGYLAEAGLLELAWRAATLCAAVAARAGRAEVSTHHTQSAVALEQQQRALLGDAADPAAWRRDPDLQRLERLCQGPGVSFGPSFAGSPNPPPPETEQPLLRRLLEINKRINSELRLPILLELVLDAVLELTDAERGFILLGADPSALEVRIARNMEGRELAPAERALSLSIARETVARGQAVVTVDAADDERFSQAVSVHGLRLRSVLAVPLRVKGRVVGAVYVDNRLRRGAFSPADVSVVQDFAEQAAIAIENARLHEELTARTQQVEALNQQLAQQVAAQAEQLVEVRAELAESRAAAAVRYDYSNIVGRSPQMLALFHLLDRVTDAELPVVLFGESGTGKELVARAIHFNGPRRERPFVSENCGALPETLLESILFGHVKGAFTGAHRDRKGLFEVANGGTLFLDEVGEMSPAMQTKLLRVLQNGELRRVGGDQVIRVDVRIIAASNRRLDALVAEGQFRQDLYYRLNVLAVSLPPLRERVEDIPLLVDHFLQKYSPDRPRRVSRDAMRRLMAYQWPGNVRELENEVQRMVALGGDLLGREDLSAGIGAKETAEKLPSGLDLRDHVSALERTLIRRALERTRGNQTQAAALLGLSRYGLLKKLRRYEIQTRPAPRRTAKEG